MCTEATGVLSICIVQHYHLKIIPISLSLRSKKNTGCQKKLKIFQWWKLSLQARQILKKFWTMIIMEKDIKISFFFNKGNCRIHRNILNEFKYFWDKELVLPFKKGKYWPFDGFSDISRNNRKASWASTCPLGGKTPYNLLHIFCFYMPIHKTKGSVMSCSYTVSKVLSYLYFYHWMTIFRWEIKFFSRFRNRDQCSICCPMSQTL